MLRSTALTLTAAMLLGGCTTHHSRQALDASDAQPSPEATFVSEEDSGLGILGINSFSVFLISEPDHYAVLIERLKRHYRCEKIHHAQLDFYTDNWVLVTFPIARVTAICEPPGSAAGATEGTDAPAPAEQAPAPAPAAQAPSAGPTPAETSQPDSEPAAEPAAESPPEPAPKPAADAPAAPAPQG